MIQPLNRRTARLAPAPAPKVLQFGGGNFLRGFADWMIDIMNDRTGFNGGVVIVKPTEKGDYQVLDQQEGLFHVLLRGVENGQKIEQSRLISCIQGYVHPYRQFSAFLHTATLPHLQIVISNTTEAGISFQKTDLLHDRPPGSFPAKLTQWLFHRYQHFSGSPERGCLILPCELVEKNGDRLREMVYKHARRWDLPMNFQTWIKRHVAFCNTLVDRIVPGFPTAEGLAIQEELGFKDPLLVAAEPYHLWAIEGNERLAGIFPAARAGLNVRFVDSLDEIRTLKVRLLNGAHTAMVPAGLLTSKTTVREAIEDPILGSFIQRLMQEEIIPSLHLPEAEARQYADTVIERFRNPFIDHRLSDIALHSTTKFTTRLLPSLQQFYKKYDRIPQGIALVLAALIRFYRQDGTSGQLMVRDSAENARFFLQAWKESSLENVVVKALEFWPVHPPLQAALCPAVQNWLRKIEQEGVAAALKEWSRNSG